MFEPATRSRNRRRGLEGETTAIKGEPDVRERKSAPNLNSDTRSEKGQSNSTGPPKGCSERVGPPSGNSETMGYCGSAEDWETSDESSV